MRREVGMEVAGGRRSARAVEVGLTRRLSRRPTRAGRAGRWIWVARSLQSAPTGLSRPLALAERAHKTHIAHDHV